MNGKTLTIIYPNGSKRDVTPKPSDHVRLEAHFDVSVMEATKVTHIYFLAWSALKRSTPDTPAFDEWIDTIEAIEYEDDTPEERVNPLEQAPSIDSKQTF